MKKFVMLMILIGVLPAIAACGGSPTDDNLRLASATQEVIVSQVASNGWFEVNQSNSDVEFVNGPATPPEGSGSVRLSTGPTGATPPVGGKPTLATALFDGQNLSSITGLTYWTFVEQSAITHPHLAPAIKIQVDTDGNGDRDTTLVFEPVYVLSTQGPVVLNIWQDWDTLNGPGWWNTAAVPGYPGGGSSYFTLAQFAADFPNAEIVTWHAGVEGAGFNFAAGQNSGGFWSDFIGYVDALDITFGTDNTLYNFEVTTKESCKKDGYKALGYGNQGQCVSAHNKN